MDSLLAKYVRKRSRFPNGDDRFASRRLAETSYNIDEAAKAAGISPKTWMKVPEFQVAIRRSLPAAYSQAVAKLQ